MSVAFDLGGSSGVFHFMLIASMAFEVDLQLLPRYRLGFLLQFFLVLVNSVGLPCQRFLLDFLNCRFHPVIQK